MSAPRRVARRVLRALARVLGGGEPPARVRGWVGPVAPGPGGDAREVSRALARGRRPGPADPWMPPWMARLLRSPGCAPYAVLLCAELRRAGHDAGVVLGVRGEGAHAWVECGEAAFDLEHPGGIPREELGARYSLVSRLA